MTQRHWNVVVEYDGVITQSEALTIVKRPADYPIVTVDGDIQRTRLSFGVAARTLPEATEMAWERARTLADGVISGDALLIRVITDEQVEREVYAPHTVSADEIVDTTEACEILRIKLVRQFYDLETKRDDFPPVWKELSNNRRLYLRSDVEAFDRRWERKPGRPKKVTPTVA